MNRQDIRDKFYDLIELFETELLEFTLATGIPVEELHIVRYHTNDDETTAYSITAFDAEEAIDELEE